MLCQRMHCAASDMVFVWCVCHRWRCWRSLDSSLGAMSHTKFKSMDPGMVVLEIDHTNNKSTSVPIWSSSSIVPHCYRRRRRCCCCRLRRRRTNVCAHRDHQRRRRRWSSVHQNGDDSIFTRQVSIAPSGTYVCAGHHRFNEVDNNHSNNSSKDLASCVNERTKHQQHESSRCSRQHVSQ